MGLLFKFVDKLRYYFIMLKQLFIPTEMLGIMILICIWRKNNEKIFIFNNNLYIISACSLF